MPPARPGDLRQRQGKKTPLPGIKTKEHLALFGLYWTDGCFKTTPFSRGPGSKVVDMASLPLTVRKLRRSLIQRCTRLRLLGAGVGEEALANTIVEDPAESGPHSPRHTEQSSPAQSQPEPLPDSASERPLLRQGSPLPLSWRFGEEEYVSQLPASGEGASGMGEEEEVEASVLDTTFLSPPLDTSASSTHTREGDTCHLDSSTDSFPPPREDVSLTLSQSYTSTSEHPPEHSSLLRSPSNSSSIPDTAIMPQSPLSQSQPPSAQSEDGDSNSDSEESDECPFCGCNLAHTKLRGQSTLTQMFPRI